jgi:hypothetical protein
MKMIKYILLLTSIYGLNINNIDKPKCINCKHFIRADSSYRNTYDGLCGFNGDSNLIIKEISYEKANDCRKDESKCGLNGKNFEEDSFKEYKDFVSFFKDNGLVVITISTVITYCLLLIKASSYK